MEESTAACRTKRIATRAFAACSQIRVRRGTLRILFVLLCIWLSLRLLVFSSSVSMDSWQREEISRSSLRLQVRTRPEGPDDAQQTAGKQYSQGYLNNAKLWPATGLATTSPPPPPPPPPLPPSLPSRTGPTQRSPELSKYPTGRDFMDLYIITSGLNTSNKNASMVSILRGTAAATKAGGNNRAGGGGAAHTGTPVGNNSSSGNGDSVGDDGGCSTVDMSVLAKSMACGAPLGYPCFHRSRCKSSPRGGPGPSIYVYDETCSLANSSALPPSNESLMLSHTWREAARDAGVLSESYKDACMFVHVNKRTDRSPCATTSPLWNGGANHVMVDLSDRTRDRRKDVAKSTAMDASSNERTCYYRSGFDFAVPLRHMSSFSNVTYLEPWKREYFLTIKGSLYLSGNGRQDRLSLVPLHNEPEGVVIALNCFEMHDEHLLPENRAFCDTLNVTASRHQYEDLMNSTFGLVPGGRSPATYRLAEVMSAGAIPVFVATDYVRPFPERIDWPSFSYIFPPEDVEEAMMDTLRALTPAELWEMQRKSLEAFFDVFGEEPGYGRIARVVIDELVKRVGYHR